ncbi:AraC family transcriptional regulator [Mesorhizobium sp. 1M-11]|uniref:helix-turn-helix domain-containing protein n=1 Tax=Mesorhizobium sp. 1M-11 TaxID=1529006 RepID=UPI0006C76B5F|nr:AraC family transcriptional regulator [Mesorhizobium sp. 1M-11]
MPAEYKDRDEETSPQQFVVLRRAPAPRLRSFVTDICGYRETTGGHYRQVEYAPLAVPLVINFEAPFAIALGRAPSKDDRYHSFAAGLYAGPVLIDSFGQSCCLQVNFTLAGARRFFGMSLSELTDRMVPLDDVLGAGGHALREVLGNEPDWDRRFDTVEAFITRRLAATPAQGPQVAWAVERVLESGGKARIGTIATELAWSRKHLVERFRDATGMAPKTVARMVRFNRALALSRRGDDNWAGIAADCGYADQAHLAREFRDFAGATPSTLSG